MVAIEHIRRAFFGLGVIEFFSAAQMALYDSSGFPTPGAFPENMFLALRETSGPGKTLRKPFCVMWGVYLSTLGAVRLAYAKGKPSLALWWAMFLTHAAETLLFWLWELDYRANERGGRPLLTTGGGRTLRDAASDHGGVTGLTGGRGVMEKLRLLLAAMQVAFVKASAFKRMLLLGPGMMTACIVIWRRPYLRA